MADMNRQSARILATKPGSSSGGSGIRFHRNLTDEEKAEHEAETKAAYEVWRREREERIARRRLAQYTNKTVFM
jgi:hypothetical protein